MQRQTPTRREMLAALRLFRGAILAGDPEHGEESKEITAAVTDFEAVLDFNDKHIDGTLAKAKSLAEDRVRGEKFRNPGDHNILFKER